MHQNGGFKQNFIGIAFSEGTFTSEVETKQKMETKQTTNNSLVFNVALGVFFILFLIILNHLPFTEGKSFFQLAGITLGSCIFGAMLFAIAMNIIDSLLQFIVEVAIAFLLFINVTAIAIACALFENIKFLVAESGNDWIRENSGIAAALTIGLILFIMDIAVAFILIPMTRIVGTKVLE